MTDAKMMDEYRALLRRYEETVEIILKIEGTDKRHKIDQKMIALSDRRYTMQKFKSLLGFVGELVNIRTGRRLSRESFSARYEVLSHIFNSVHTTIATEPRGTVKKTLKDLGVISKKKQYTAEKATKEIKVIDIDYIAESKELMRCYRSKINDYGLIKAALSAGHVANAKRLYTQICASLKSHGIAV